jgi:hypothetical protein
VGRCGVAAAVADVGSLAGMSTLVIVLGLVRREGFVAAFVATGVWTVARMAEKVTRELGALLEVLGRGLATFPLAEAMSTVIDVGSLDVLVQSLGAVEDGEAEEPWGMLPD